VGRREEELVQWYVEREERPGGLVGRSWRRRRARRGYGMGARGRLAVGAWLAEGTCNFASRVISEMENSITGYFFLTKNGLEEPS
jgi:hypothetical protein